MIIPIPTPEHLAWQKRELGVLIHFDVEVYEPSYKSRQHDTLPPASVFNPAELDTDQWIRAAKAAGCTSAVFTAKHGSGFSMFPTAAYGYGVHTCPWKGGKGDIVGDFVASCRKFGLTPGLYYSVGANDFLSVHDHRTYQGATITWEEYKRLAMITLRELFTRYGDLGEIWFDGGMWPDEKDRRELADLVNEFQPHAICFGGDPDLVKSVRHSGNEGGTTLPWCFSASDGPSGAGDYLNFQRGRRDGKFYYPQECITTLKDHKAFYDGWFWKEGEDHLTRRPEDLLDIYYQSVGHNSTLLIGMEIDNRGLLPESDVAVFERFGELLRGQFADCIASCEGQPGQMVYELPNPNCRPVNMIELREDITQGEHVGWFQLYGVKDNGETVFIMFGDAVGNCLLDRFPAAAFPKFRLVLDNKMGSVGGTHKLDRFALYNAPRF